MRRNRETPEFLGTQIDLTKNKQNTLRGTSAVVHTQTNGIKGEAATQLRAIPGDRGLVAVVLSREAGPAKRNRTHLPRGL